MGQPYTLAPDVEFRPKECVLEIGSDRGEGSTGFWAEYSKNHETEFFTVDFNKWVYGRAKDAIEGYDNCIAFQAKGEDFIDSWFTKNKMKVRVAYLDNYDWWWKTLTPESEHIRFGEEYYTPYGLSLNNDASQEAHRKQSELLLPHLAEDSWIIFDDTWSTGKGWNGKGGTAVPFLLEHGYKLTHDVKPMEENPDGYVILRGSPS
jgi:hypothetical protein